MKIETEFYSAEELTAAADFFLVLAKLRRELNANPQSYRFERLVAATRGAEGDHRGTSVADEEVTAGEIVDALHGALTAEPAPEPVKKRPGRPRKEQPAETPTPEPTIAHYVELPDDITGEEIAEKFAGLRSGDSQIDLEDVIAATNTVSQDNVPPAPQPADPAAGWTEHDARNAGRALLARAPSPEVGNKKLAALLAPYGVQQVRALKADQIEAFVVATQKEVF